MDEQQKHSENSRPAAPASRTSNSSSGGGTPGPAAGAVKRHRGRNIALIVAALVILGVVLWRWHPWGGPGGSASGASAASGASGGHAGRRGNANLANMAQPVHVATATQGEMPVVLTALGTVTPLANVTVQPQLSGILQEVYFREGQMVKKGDVLAQIDPRPYQISLENAQGTLARDQALLQTARLDLKRYQTLLAQDSIASQQVDTQASLVRQYEGTVKSDQANIDTYKLDLVYARITAPTSGRVGLRQVDPGNYVTPSLTNGIVVITQLQPISVIFTTSEDNLQQIIQQTQGGGKLSVTAYDRSNTTSLEGGMLETLDNQIDTTTGTVKLRGIFQNPKNLLFPNQFVNTRLLVNTIKDAVIVPTPSVLNGSMGQFVYVVKADNTVTVRPVKIGPVDGERTSIKSGLAVGERVVIDGSDRLKEGAKITVPADRPRGASGAHGASSAGGAAAASGASGARGHRRKHASQDSQ